MATAFVFLTKAANVCALCLVFMHDSVHALQKLQSPFCLFHVLCKNRCIFISNLHLTQYCFSQMTLCHIVENVSLFYIAQFRFVEIYIFRHGNRITTYLHTKI